MANDYTFTRIKMDANGNPRLVVSWLAFGTDTYAEAVRLSHKIGGRKYHTKSYAGGIVFQAYSESELAKDIQRVREQSDSLKRTNELVAKFFAPSVDAPIELDNVGGTDWDL